MLIEADAPARSHARMQHHHWCEAWLVVCPATAKQVVEKLFEAGSTTLVEEAGGLREVEAENARVVNNRGDLPAEAAAEYEKRRKV